MYPHTCLGQPTFSSSSKQTNFCQDNQDTSLKILLICLPTSAIFCHNYVFIKHCLSSSIISYKQNENAFICINTSTNIYFCTGLFCSLKTNIHKHQREGPAVFLDETVAGIRNGRTREEQRRENTAGKGQCQGG